MSAVAQQYVVIRTIPINDWKHVENTTCLPGTIRGTQTFLSPNHCKGNVQTIQSSTIQFTDNFNMAILLGVTLGVAFSLFVTGCV